MHAHLQEADYLTYYTYYWPDAAKAHRPVLKTRHVFYW